jgi:hypothetical protein
MDAREQAEGEKRVRQLLIEPLLERGLSRPKGIKVADFEKIVEKTICPKLAYMTPANLSALEFQIAAHPEGKERDQMPIPNKILAMAADIQEPGDEASPLLLAVFAAQLGADAIANGWAPELRRWLKKERKWPKSNAVGLIKEEASAAHRRVQDIEARRRAGEDISKPDDFWVASREAAQQKCEQIRALALSGEGVEA